MGKRDRRPRGPEGTIAMWRTDPRWPEGRGSHVTRQLAWRPTGRRYRGAIVHVFRGLGHFQRHRTRGPLLMKLWRKYIYIYIYKNTNHKHVHTGDTTTNLLLAFLTLILETLIFRCFAWLFGFSNFHSCLKLARRPCRFRVWCYFRSILLERFSA